MSVRAKVTVTEHRTHGWQKGGPTSTTVVLTPVYDTSIAEAQRFCKATPSGRMEMQVDNPAALAQLVIGQTFYVDFTPVDA
jgi:hypothetical protein